MKCSRVYLARLEFRSFFDKRNKIYAFKAVKHAYVVQVICRTTCFMVTCTPHVELSAEHFFVQCIEELFSSFQTDTTFN